MAEKPLKQDDAMEVIGFHPEWIDEDFNPNGTRVGFVNADAGFTCARWCNYHDCYETVDNTLENVGDHLMPTHYAFIPSTALLPR